jgi:hypothetical protein
VRLVLLATTALLLLTSSAASAKALAPPNDDFADAIALTPVAEGFVEGTNVNATEELGEPDHAGNSGGRSVWYSWTAPMDGSIPNLSITVFADFDTLLAVYTGAAVALLTPVASNDDVSGGSTVSFATTPGTTYRVAVDGFQGKMGRFFAVWSEAPPNDNFADATTLSGASGSRSGDTIAGATVEPGEPDPFGTGGSVWYEWTPPADGTYKLSTFGSTFDTILAVYEGTSLEALTTLRVNDDDPDRGCCSSWVPLVNAQATTTYMIQVSPLGFGEGADDIVLQWGPLVLGSGGANVLNGTAGAEELRGLGGNDLIRGFGGNDLVFGGRGNDDSRGGAGNDFLLDRVGVDVLRGEGGNDTLNTRDRRRDDRAIGGAGTDRCFTDATDVRRSCP